MSETDTQNIPLNWQVGDVIADLYEVTDILGEGGMGIVYKVHHKKWNVYLAVKSIRPEIISETSLENFIKEAETWINLGLHPNIVSCYYVRQLGEIPRIFSEYVKSGSLKDWIQSGELYKGTKEEVLNRILNISIKSAWGLQYAHEQGLIHQDVKPANILLDTNVEVKVTDFGIAKAKMSLGEKFIPLKEGSILIPSGAMTPLYCSPEQAEGKSISRKTDIWSWAVSVLEMFTGGVHWVSGTIAATVLDEYLINGSDNQNIPTIPEKLSEILKQCFKYNPLDRPKDFEEISNKLVNIHKEITNTFYISQIPKNIDLLADSLNNKAISFLDLNKYDRAEKCWKEALIIDPQHLESTFNYGYFRWKKAEITDDTLVKHMEAIKFTHINNPEYWLSLGWIHYERGDVNAINEIQNSDYKITEKIFIEALSIKEKPIGTLKKKFKLLFSGVQSVCFSPDGKSILTGNNNKTMCLWDIDSGRIIKKFKGHINSVRAVCFSRDGKYALSGSHSASYDGKERDTSMRLWDIMSGKEIKIFTGHTSNVNCVSFSPDGKYALSGSSDKTIRIWDINSGKEIKRLGEYLCEIVSICFSPDGKFILSSGYFTKEWIFSHAINKLLFQLWDFETGKLINKFESEIEDGASVSYSPDGKFSLLGSNLLYVEHWRLVNKFKANSKTVNSICFSPDNKFVLSGGDDNSVRLWNFKTGKVIRSFEGHIQEVNSVCFSPDGKYIASGSSDQTIGVWNIYFPNKDYNNNYPILNKVKKITEILVQKEIITNEFKKIKYFIDNRKYSEALELIEQSQKANKYKKSIDLLKIKNLCCTDYGWCKNTLIGHSDYINSLCVSSDSKYVLSGSSDGTIRLWDINSANEIKKYLCPNEKIDCVCFSSDGKFLLSGSTNFTQGNVILKLWRKEYENPIKTYKWKFIKHPLGNFIRDVSFSIDGKSALVALSPIYGSSTVLTIDLDSGNLVKESIKLSGEVISECFSSNKRFVMSISKSFEKENLIRIWDVESGLEMNVLKGHKKPITSASFSLDSIYLVSASSDNSIRIWDIKSGKEIRKINVKNIRANSVCFSPNGEIILSGNDVGNVYLWDVKTGKEITKFDGHTKSISSVCFTTDGNYILSGSNDMSIRLWEFEYNENKTPNFNRYIHGLGTYFNKYKKKINNIFNKSKFVPSFNEVNLNNILLKSQQEYDSNKIRESYCTIKEFVNLKKQYSNNDTHKKLISLYNKIGKKGNKTKLREFSLINTFEGHKAQINSIGFSNCGKYIVSGSNDNSIKLWDCDSGRCINTFEGHQNAVNSVCISPNGKLIFSGSLDKTTKLWDINTGQCIKTFNEHTESVRFVYFSSKGEYTFSASSDYQLHVVDLKSNICFLKIDSSDLFMTWESISPDEKYLLSNDTTINVVDINSVKIIIKIQRNDTIYSSVCFSPNMKYILSGSNEIILFDIKSKTQRKYFNNPNVEISAISFSPNSNFFAAGCNDKTIKLYDILNNNIIATFLGHNREINDVCFSPDGNYLLSGSSDKTIKLWQLIWNYEIPESADWDEGARPYLEIFLELQKSYIPDTFTRKGKPVWNDEDFNNFYDDLQNRGFGWLRKDGVRAELEKMTRSYYE